MSFLSAPCTCSSHPHWGIFLMDRVLALPGYTKMLWRTQSTVLLSFASCLINIVHLDGILCEHLVCAQSLCPHFSKEIFFFWETESQKMGPQMRRELSGETGIWWFLADAPNTHTPVPHPSPWSQCTHFPCKRLISYGTKWGAHNNESLITKLFYLIAFVWPWWKWAVAVSIRNVNYFPG